MSTGSLTGLSRSHNIKGRVFSNPPLVGPGNLSFLFLYVLFFFSNLTFTISIICPRLLLGIEIGITSSPNQLILKGNWVRGGPL